LSIITIIIALEFENLKKMPCYSKLTKKITSKPKNLLIKLVRTYKNIVIIEKCNYKKLKLLKKLFQKSRILDDL